MDSHSAPPEDSRLERCGFCKLYGPELEFYSRRYDIQIGRRSKSTKLDVVLGDNMNISRTHAKIEYNFEKGAWEMAVMGKNGVTVQGTLYTPADGQPATGIPLHSQDYIQIGDKAFYFLLPRSQARQAPAPGAPAAKRPRTNGVAESQSHVQPAAPGVSRPAPTVRPADAAPLAPAPAAPAVAAAVAADAAPGTADAANGQLEAEVEDDMGPDDYDEY